MDIKKLKLNPRSEYATEYVKIFVFESRGFNNVRTIFDRYIDESLKAGTSSERTGGETARCKIADDTCIEHVTAKKFLSDIHTKNELTKYLSKKLYQALKSVAFVISY